MGSLRIGLTPTGSTDAAARIIGTYLAAVEAYRNHAQLVGLGEESLLDSGRLRHGVRWMEEGRRRNEGEDIVEQEKKSRKRIGGFPETD
jgi:hypothetical protein